MIRLQKTLVKPFLKLIVALGLLSTPLSASAAFNIYLLLDNIKGEVTDVEFRDQINVLSWSEGGSNLSTIGSSGGGAGKVNFEALTIVKRIDSSSTELRLRMAQGVDIQSAVLSVVRNSGPNSKSNTFFKIEMTDVLVTSVSAGGSAGSDELTETITLVFGTIKWTYTPQLPNGSAGSDIETGWDLATNKKL